MKKNKYTDENFIEKFTITDKKKIRVAMSMPKSMPKSFLKTLEPIGISKFKGDSLPENWSVNNHFTIGNIYPIYDIDDDDYPISDKTGVGMKMTPKAWSKVKYI